MFRASSRACWAGALSIWMSCAVVASPADEQMTVTAGRLQAAKAGAARVPGGANIVGSAEYADGRASNLLDMLGMTPGVYIQPRFGAEEARLSIRGSGLQRTFHLRGIYLLQDGVPLTLADGAGDFQAVEPMALAYTEVMRGANALRYGGTSLGGSINFVSPTGQDTAGWHPRLESGSFGYRRVFVSSAWSWDMADETGAGDAFFSLSGYRQDGFRDWSEQENARLFGNIGVRLGAHALSRFFVSGVHSDSQLPGSLTRAQLRADPVQASAGSLAGRQKRDYDLYRLASHTVLEWGEDSVELSFGYTFKDLWHPIFQVLQQTSNDYSAGLRYVSDGMLWGRIHRFVAGFAPSWNTVKDDRFVNLAGQPDASTGASRQRSRNLALYAESQLQLTSAWTLVAGAQWTDAQRRYEDRFLSNGDQSLDTGYIRSSPKLGVLWQPQENWTVFANISDSFEPPSFGELSGGPGVDLLDAQHARTLEIGTRGAAGRWHWDVAAYSAQVRDELLAQNTPDGQPLGTVNAPRTVHRGLEGAVALQLATGLSWHTSLLVNDFHFDNHPVYGNNELPGLPPQLYRSELAWTPLQGYTVTVSGEWSPDRYAVDMANSWFADAHALWGIKLARTTQHGISWFVEGRNLADRRYAAATGVVADAGGQDIAQFLPGDGRAVYAGVEWRM